MLRLKLNLKKILTDSCDILQPNQEADSYGRKSQSLVQVPVVLASGLACRLLPLKGGREFKAEKGISLSSFAVYIMPWTSEDGKISINEHLWFRINGSIYNILDVPPQLIPGAPLEITVEQIKP